MCRDELTAYFDDICGYEDIKQELMYLADIMRDPEPYKALGARVPRNVMIKGAPGVGKTLMSECLIKASGRRAYRVRKEDNDNDFISTITGTFRKARDTTPSIVFLDDMDKYSSRGFGRSTEEATVQACIDDVKDAGVFVIATVNEDGGISHSLRRAGRFDRYLTVDRPDRDSAREIIRRYFSETKTISNDISIEDVVDLTGGMTAVEIRTLANEAGVYAGFDRSDVIGMDHIISAYVSRMDNTRMDNHSDDAERSRVTACHEAGHAVISELLRRGSVGMVFSGREAGMSEGFMSRIRTDRSIGINRYRYEILTALGGRAATELVYGMPDRGAVNDLGKAIMAIESELTELCTEGVRFASDNSSYRHSSVSRTNMIDHMVRARLTAYYDEAKEILTGNRPLLDRMSEELDRCGYLLSEDITRIIDEVNVERKQG